MTARTHPLPKRGYIAWANSTPSKAAAGDFSTWCRRAPSSSWTMRPRP